MPINRLVDDRCREGWIERVSAFNYTACLLDLVFQWFRPQRLGADDAQDDQRQPDAERPPDAEMFGDIAEQRRSQQERDE
jgi:hypothetical protein